MKIIRMQSSVYIALGHVNDIKTIGFGTTHANALSDALSRLTIVACEECDYCPIADKNKAIHATDYGRNTCEACA